MGFLVYGDAAREVGTQEALAELTDGIAAIADIAPSIERHAALVGALIEAGQLAQGFADAAAQAAGRDEISPGEQAAMRLTMTLAVEVGRSWERGFQTATAVAPCLAALRALGEIGGPAQITVKQPEGYAFYALYPESYFAAARRFRDGGAWRVVGIRSIGSSLAAAVAAALNAPPPLTVRPVGHPFARQVAAGPELSKHLSGRHGGKIALVDEGPGLSGSSFGALADLLEANGAARENLHIFPGHSGDLGPQASAAHRARWATMPRHTVGFEQLWLREGDANHLRHWAADLVGPADGPLEDISGGAWRERVIASGKPWPAAHVGQERRKFLLRAGGKTWLLKFSGLGREGARKLAMGKALATAGFMPQIAGMRHGFLVEAWRDDARPLDERGGLDGGGLDRVRFFDRVADYLAFRARRFPAGAAGASPATLLEMATHNAAQSLGEDVRPMLQRWTAKLPALAAAAHPVAVDGRMHPHEWIQTPGGGWLKTDALDHHAAHDLVGCQDIAWDIAGAAAEFEMSDGEVERLREGVERRVGRAVSPHLVGFCRTAYLAFQLGRSVLACEQLGGMADEQNRLQTDADRYEKALRQQLGAQSIV